MRYLLASLLSLIFILTSTAQLQAAEVENYVLEGQVTQITDEVIIPTGQGLQGVRQSLEIYIQKGIKTGETVNIEFNQMQVEGVPLYKVGDRLLVNYSLDSDGNQSYYIIDYVRRPSLILLIALFAGAAVAVSGWRGVSSLLGLIASFIIIFTIILPGIKSGHDPILIAIFGSFLIILFTFYLAHGFNHKTHLAIAGTLFALCLTAGLSHIWIGLSQLTGYSSEASQFLQSIAGQVINIRGLLLAGIMIGALGVLDDITISQAALVRELKLANPKLNAKQLFIRGMNVGRDHIASLINTLVLVYTGAALPLLLLFTLDATRPPMVVINYEIVAEEIVRTLVGSIGLISAVPITTILAAKFYGKST